MLKPMWPISARQLPSTGAPARLGWLSARLSSVNLRAAAAVLLTNGRANAARPFHYFFIICFFRTFPTLCYNGSAMSLSIEEVRHIAHLARLKLSAADEKRYAEQLSAILEYAERLQAVDTSHIPPTANVLSLRAPLREDQPRPSTPRARILENAQEHNEEMFRVPPVLDNEP